MRKRIIRDARGTFFVPKAPQSPRPFGVRQPVSALPRRPAVVAPKKAVELEGSEGCRTPERPRYGELPAQKELSPSDRSPARAKSATYSTSRGRRFGRHRNFDADCSCVVGTREFTNSRAVT